MFSQLLVPLDFTDKNEAAIAIAIETARRDGAEVTLLHVIETIDHMEFDEMADFYRKLEARAAARMAVLVERFVGAGVRARFEIVFGKRAESILEQTAGGKIDLVVLSSHRVDREHPALGLGTISYQVAIVARCPVLLVK
ncbi:MAG TPA: universal stress protein [Thermoanaerobaculia bacterium]|jgi:nucleotide-binding universal stress UspA family protein|nr:universal stress protein [Thermoanaerobaculia bacterium]